MKNKNEDLHKLAQIKSINIYMCLLTVMAAEPCGYFYTSGNKIPFRNFSPL